MLGYTLTQMNGKAVARRFVYDVRYREKGRHTLTGVPSLPSTKRGYNDELIGPEGYPGNDQADDIFDRQWARNTLEIRETNAKVSTQRKKTKGNT